MTRLTMGSTATATATVSSTIPRIKKTSDEIDAYAQQLIVYMTQLYHNSETSVAPVVTENHQQLYHHIDDSLGPYITNCFRTFLTTMSKDGSSKFDTTNLSHMNIAEISDYESFCELLQEHCQIMDENIVHNTLQTIWNVVVTQEIPINDPPTITIIEQQGRNDNTTENGTTKTINISNNGNHLSPLNANDLLPESLWNDVITPTNVTAQTTTTSHNDNTIPTTSSTVITPTTTTNTTINKDEDSNVGIPPPITSTTATMIQSFNNMYIQSTIDNTIYATTGTHQNHRNQQEEYGIEEEQQQQHDQYGVHDHQLLDDEAYIIPQVVGMLLQMFAPQNLSEDAAYAATMMAQCNVHVAQYMIHHAFTQLPICRNLINDYKCYRADCTYNHDIENHTCVFWLKARCSKGIGSNNNSGGSNAEQACRFLHGFSEKLLHNIPDHVFQQQQQHSITPYRSLQEFHAASHPTSTVNTVGNNYNMNNAYINNSSNASHVNPHTTNSVWSTSNKNSFATIASKGYSTKQSFVETTTNDTTTRPRQEQSIPKMDAISTILIPQNLWQAHENRDASAFFIVDPLERYHTVSSKVPQIRKDVIDLHYQSIKTFPIVLDTILPPKIESILVSPIVTTTTTNDTTTGIWIITGTGHHVNTQRTHQKSGGALESAVLEYLWTHYCCNTTTATTTTGPNRKYRIYKGRDRNGKGGAIFLEVTSSSIQQKVDNDIKNSYIAKNTHRRNKK